MSRSLYEDYKESLRRGHVAMLRGRLDVAMAAYREASRIAPDRALPHVGLGGVLARMGRPGEALAAYRTALERAPDDEGALRGRADLLAANGRRAEAARSLDRLAGVFERAGRTADACDVARRALELAESRGRRRLVQTLVARLRESTADPTAALALDRALGVLELDAMEAADPAAARVEGMVEFAGESLDLDPILGAPPDPIALDLAFEAAVDAGDFALAHRQAVASAAAHRTAGQFHASIDVCYEALAVAPADPGIHFALAQLYLDRGWRSLAADKLMLVGRLAQLTDDGATKARLCDLVARLLPDDARLAAMCA